MTKPLNRQELHNLAMNYVGRELQKNGFEFVSVNSQQKKHPQFVCIDNNNQYYFVIVKVVILPKDPNSYDVVWMELFKKHAEKNNAKVLYAGIALGNPNGTDLPIFKDETYLIRYDGIKLIENNLN